MRSDAYVTVSWGTPAAPAWTTPGAPTLLEAELRDVLDALEDAVDDAREQMDLAPVFRGCQKCKGRVVSLPSGVYSTLPTHEQKLRAAELILKANPEDEVALAFLRLMIVDHFTVPAGAKPPGGWMERADAEMLARASEPVLRWGDTLPDGSLVVDRWCGHCEAHTLQVVRDAGHERDSSGDWQKCNSCGWEKSGHGWSAPAN